jgi:chorismate mutase
VPYGGLRSSQADELLRLRAQNTAIDAEIVSLTEERENIRRNVAELEARVEKSPNREQEMISLTRDYENLKQQYDDLLKKRLDAQVFQNLEKRQKGEQFQILDPADLPQKPFFPNRPKVFGIALGLALAIGFGGAICIEMLNPALRGKRDFLHFFHLPVLASIPILRDGEYERRKHRNLAVVCGGLVSFALALTVFLVIYGHKVRTLILGTFS